MTLKQIKLPFFILLSIVLLAINPNHVNADQDSSLPNELEVSWHGFFDEHRITQKSENLPINEIVQQFKFLGTRPLFHISIPNHSYWIKIHTLNKTRESNNYVFSLNKTGIDRVVVYEQDQHKNLNKIRELGKNFKFFPRDLDSIDPHFLIKLNKFEKRTFYIEIFSHKKVTLRPTIEHITNYFNKIYDEQFKFGLYFGGLILVILHGLFFFIYLKQKDYLYYFLYLCCFGVSQFTMQRYSFQYLWPDYPLLNDSMPFVIANITLLMSIAFIKQFLTSIKMPKSYYSILRIVQVYVALTAIIPIISHHYIFNVIVILIGLLSAAYLLTYHLITAVKSKFRPSYTFSVGWFFFLLGVFYVVLSKVGLIEYNTQVYFTFSSLEVLIISFAMGIRVRHLNEEKIATDKLLLEQEKNMSVMQALDRKMRDIRHDSKSPLQALENAIDEVESMRLDARQMAGEAISRLREMLRDTLIKNNESSKISFILPGIDQIIQESRFEYASYKNIQISYEMLGEDLRGLFADVNLFRLKRVISNLINNAVEALENSGNGQIKLTLVSGHNEDPIQILISDNGHGIPKDILHKVLDRDFTYGKKQGSGQGLSSAKEYLTSLGGELKIQSREGAGTTITLIIPKVVPFDYMCPPIDLPQNLEGIVVVDDDPYILQIWKNKIQEQNIDLPLICFNEVQEAAKFIEKNVKKLSSYRFITDYSFPNEFLSGIDLITHYKLKDIAFLFTNMDEEPFVQEQCRNLQISLWPKNMLKFLRLKQS